MAQGAVAALPTHTNGATLTAEELREILEYDRIVQFRDAVLSGIHPRVKIPPHLAGKHVNSALNVSSPNLSTPSRANLHAQSGRSNAGSHQEESSSFYNRSPKNTRQPASTHLAMSTKSEINPILLEKSDDLIKAEIQLQRQRLERGLREQIEQQRTAAKSLLQTSESLPNFDISEVLSKALAIVQPCTTAQAEPSVGARSSASDSFDEKTFYSSQHDTPEPSSSSQGQKDSVDMQSHQVISVDEHPAEKHSAQIHVADQHMVPTSTSLSKDNHLAKSTPLQTQPSYSNHQLSATIKSGRDLEMELSRSNSSRGAIAIDASTTMSTQRPGTVSEPESISLCANSTVSCPVKDKLADRLPAQNAIGDRLQQSPASISPVVRAHNLSPIAPQPARVSPLATARNPPLLRGMVPTEEAQPAQVSALRNQPTRISSTDSSPKGVKTAERKKEKRKKRRKTKDTADTPDSPFIKPEPQSPSPYAVAPLPRPQKRQRHSGQYTAELNYDEPEVIMQEHVPERFKGIPPQREYERYESHYEPRIRKPEPAYQRVQSENVGYRCDNGGHYALQPHSPASSSFAVPYAHNEVRPFRAASHAVVERRDHEEPRYYKAPIPQASVRADADRERSMSPILRERRSPVPMAPPRQPVRIMVDEYGRRYYDPVLIPSMRQSVAPPISYRDPERVYGPPPGRAVSSRIPVDEYEEDGVVYRRASPAMTTPRRVVTQPEFATPPQPEYRSYRQREYSVRPTAMAPPGEEYVQIRRPDRRQTTQSEHVPLEYAARAPSVRPEVVRYEIPQEYDRRLQSVRPEGPPEEYAASMRPEGRREVLSQSQREYSVRPSDLAPRREPVPEERYYGREPSRRPAEIAFIERPRARESSVLVYADDVRREIYR